jgi:hypothetical protein
MKLERVLNLLVVLVLALGMAQSKPKKPAVPAVFENAHYVYVEAIDGDVFKPGLLPEDRQAIYQVEQRVRDWNRYAITTKREQADLIFVIRKGRIADAQTHVGLGPHPQQPQPGVLQPGQSSAPMQTQSRDQGSYGAEAGVGPADDLLRVYTLSGEGKLMGPVWSRSQDGGLDGPSVQLIEQLKTAVEHAYPQTPPNKQPTP